MRSKIPFVLGFGIVTAFLSSCSLMGSRKESTKKDLEEASISQLKVYSKPTEKKTPDNNNSFANDTTKIGLEMRYLPSLDVKKYVQDEDINLKQIIGEEELPKEMDRASLFFGLDGKISGTLDIKSEPDEGFIEQTGYDEAVASGKKDELVAKDASCAGNIEDIFAEGSAKFDLSQTQLDDLAKNTIKEDGSNAREELVKEVQKAKGDQTIDVTKIVFNDLSESTQKGIKALFKPDVGLLLLIKAYYMQVCYSPTGKNSAFISDKDGYRYISPESIKTEQVDGKLKLEIQEIKKITEKKLQESNFVLKNSDEKIPFASLTFGEGIPVFANTERNEVTHYTLYHENLKQPEVDQPTETTDPLTDPAKIDQEEVVPAVDTKAPDATTVTEPLPVTDNSQSTSPSTNTTTTTVTNNSNVPFKLKDKPVTYNQDKNTTTKADVPSSLQTNEAYEASQKNTASKKTTETKKSENVSKNSDKKATPPEAIAEIPAIVKAFAKPAGKPIWYNAKINGHSKNFYEVDEANKEVKYNPGTDNFKFWNLDQYRNSPSLTDAEVEIKSKSYEYTRDMNFSIALKQPREASLATYFTFPNTNVTKSYSDVLFDQFSIYSEDASIIKMLVQAALHTPNGVNKQDWKIKVCFNQDGKFTAFFSSSEMKANNFRMEGSTVVLTGNDSRIWREISFQDQFNNKPPEGFNSARKKYGLSNFWIDSSKGTGKEMAFLQLDIKRLMTPRILMAYINSDYVSPTEVKRLGFNISVSKQRILNEIEASFEKSPNKNEIIIYGGFAFDPTVKHAKVDYMDPQDLSLAGYNQLDYNPGVAGVVIFPGDNSELYINASKN